MTAPLLNAYRPSTWWNLGSYAYLLRLLLRKELHVRYQGSTLGMVWSYIKPAVQFGVFYFAVGIFLGMRDVVESFAVYLFSGIVVVNYVSEAAANATRAVVANAPLVKKVYFPRQLFPLASVLVAAVHFLPQLLVLLVGALFSGWQPTWATLGIALGAGLAGFVLASAVSLGIGLLAGGLNVAFRDTENFVDLVLMVLPWLSPVMYTSAHVAGELGVGSWLGQSPWWWLYHANPITGAVELFHTAWWVPTQDPEAVASWPLSIHELWLVAGIGAVIAVILVVVGQRVFASRDGNFAQVL